MTTTVSGQVITGTTFGIQAVEASSSGSASGSAAAGSKATLLDSGKIVVFAGVAAASMFGLMVAL